MKLISWVFVALLAVAVIILSVGNKESVTFSFFPLPFVMDVPLFLLILAGAFFGVLLGAFRTWLSDGKLRRENRELKREALKMEGDIARLSKILKENEEALQPSSQNNLKITDQSA